MIVAIDGPAGTGKSTVAKIIAEKLNITDRAISKWENGNYMPPVDVLVLLSEMYNVSINEILTGQNENSLGKQ